MNKKLIRLTESDLHRIVKESVKEILMKSDSPAEAQFKESDFANKLYKKFSIEDVAINEDGIITVWDYLTDKEYKEKADYEINYHGLGYPSQGNPYNEAEGTDVVYDFDTAFENISRQIKRDRRIR